jgi:hypothetical protein
MNLFHTEYTTAFPTILSGPFIIMPIPSNPASNGVEMDEVVYLPASN